MTTPVIYNNMSCPLCDHKGLEARDHNETYAYICPECPFVGFEYYTDKNLEDLKMIIK